jgi:hypothetical protein
MTKNKNAWKPGCRKARKLDSKNGLFSIIAFSHSSPKNKEI